MFDNNLNESRNLLFDWCIHQYLHIFWWAKSKKINLLFGIYEIINSSDNLNETKDLLSTNEVITGRFIVEEKIGQGSFGQIYRHLYIYLSI